MIAGVELNGREYVQGDPVLYFPVVARHFNQPGVGGLDGVSTSVCCGIINMFYSFEGAVLIDLTAVPIVRKNRSMHIVRNYAYDVSEAFKDYVNTMNKDGRLLIHIDSVSCKVHFAPDPYDNQLTCAIPMWDAR